LRLRRLREHRAVALVAAGDSAHLHDFVTKASGSATEVANLNYWVYWLGELTDDQTSDDFMADDDPSRWAGMRLLQPPHHPAPSGVTAPGLNLRTVHALVASRPVLLTGWSSVGVALGEALDRVASSDTVTRTGRDQVAGLYYALRIADR
jgi:hypothetical protein